MSSGHVHDKGIDGTVSSSWDDAQTGPRKGQAGGGRTVRAEELARDEYQKMTEELKKVLEDKENDLCHAKEAAILEYCDSDALLSELGVSYNDGFDDALRQAKALYPKLDFSFVNITVPEATSIHPEQSDDTNELFGEEVPVSVAPEHPTVEGGEAREAKDSAAPNV